MWDPCGGEAVAELWDSPASHVLPVAVPSGLTGFGCLLMLQGRRRHCLLGASFTFKLFDMTQAEFIKHWCLHILLENSGMNAV